MGKYTEQKKIEAVAFALATSYGRAAEKYGASKSTIYRWKNKYEHKVDQSKYDFDIEQQNGTEQNEEQSTNQKTTARKVKKISEEATKKATENVTEDLEDEIKALSNDMLQTAWKAVDEIDDLIQTGKEGADKDKWLKAVVGAMDYLVKNSNLITGEPTDRVEGDMTFADLAKKARDWDDEEETD